MYNMNGLGFIQRKQVAWAIRTGLEPIGSTFQNEGEKNYLEKLEDNLFQPLTVETRKQLEDGGGKETEGYLKDGKHYRPKINALHSSAAIAVNTFQYWQNKDVYPILYACGLCPTKSSNVDIPLANKISFEEKFPISDDKETFQTPPNIDVVIDNFQSKIYAIESKLTEPYRRKKPEETGIRKDYLENPFWDGLSNLKDLAEKLCPNDNVFQHLDAAQLIRHILGLKRNHNKSGFRLLYLWYDVIGQDGAEHRKEIEQFAEIAKGDNINFSHITYQEVITKLTKEFYEGNEEYCNYLTNRYL